MCGDQLLEEKYFLPSLAYILIYIFTYLQLYLYIRIRNRIVSLHTDILKNVGKIFVEKNR